MRKKRRKPPQMPKWFWWCMDGCWCCKDRNNCNNCKEVRKYRKKFLPKKTKGRHDEPSLEDS